MVWDLRIENIAGIRRGETTIESGINAVRANNWQGKSSFLAAIETAMGTKTPLTEGEDRGSVLLRTEDGEHEVELVRENGTVVRRGSPTLTDEYDAVCADLYAFLDTDNDVRRAVRNGENLEDVLTQPLDFENIDERIADLKHEREGVETELSRAEEAAERLPALQERITGHEDRLAELRERRDELAVDDEGDGQVSEARTALSDARAEREQVRERAERLERTVERTREKLESRREEHDAIDVPDDDDVEAELARIHDKATESRQNADLLQSLYTASKRVLDEGKIDLVADVERTLGGDSFECLLCGSETERDEFQARLDDLGDRVAALRAEAGEYEERVEELESERDETRQARRRKSDLADEIAELEATLADRTESKRRTEERLDELNERVDELSSEVATSDEERTDVESEIKYVENELDEAREELESVESRSTKRETLEAERERLAAEIEELRNRKDALRRRTREAFDAAMSEILTRFDTGFETARLTSTFDLVVAREGREASLDALSEGELELLGFVAALAGHEAFDVADRVPVLLLDGLGGLADQNLHALIDYLDGRAQFLVFTAYPEHGTFDGHEIDPTDWAVVSDGSEVEARA